MSSSIPFVVLGLGFAIACIVLAAIDRDAPAFLMYSLLTLVYPVDALYVAATGKVFLALSIGPQPVQDRDLVYPAMFVLAFFVIILAFQFFHHLRRSELNSAILSVQSGGLTPNSRFWLLCALALTCTLYLGTRASQVGIDNLLQSRQELLNGSVLMLLAYNILPVATLLLLLYSSTARGIKRLASLVVAAASLVGIFVTGSRSSLLLSCILPFLYYIAANNREILASSAKTTMRRLMSLLVGVGLVYASLQFYLSEFRNVRGDIGFLGGPDISAYDALVGLISKSPNHTFTYGAAAAFMIPRDVLPGKPFPGNVVASYALTPSRYQLTGAETTAGILGEGWINFGWFGVVTAALLVSAILAAARRLLKSSEVAWYALALVLMFRGINIVRGDLVNVFVPLFSALLIVVIVRRRRHVDDLGYGSGRIHRKQLGSAVVGV